MGVPRTLGAVVVTANTPTPVFTGPVIAAASFSISGGIATIVLNGTLPKTGYNGPSGYPDQESPEQAPFRPYAGEANNGAGGQKVTLWGFTTATYFNGISITVLDNNPAAGSFRFYFNHSNVASTNDAGNTAPIPVQAYRAVRIECSQTLGTDIVYVGDGKVSSTRYVAALSLAGQIAVEIVSDNIRAENIYIDGTTNGDSVQVSLIY